MSQPTFRLTRRAAIDLREIHASSVDRWGEETANRYLDDLYAVIGRAVARPDIGRLRRHRAAPFLMIAARRHFIVYDLVPDGIVVLTVLHQVRGIEALVARLSPSFFAEIEALKSGRNDSD